MEPGYYDANHTCDRSDLGVPYRVSNFAAPRRSTDPKRNIRYLVLSVRYDLGLRGPPVPVAFSDSPEKSIIVLKERPRVGLYLIGISLLRKRRQH
jgi:hypothetical protein